MSEQDRGAISVNRWADSAADVRNGIECGWPIWFRQVTGITWGRLINSEYLNFELFDYWIGPDYPHQPASADENYPAERRPRLLQLLNRINAIEEAKP